MIELLENSASSVVISRAPELSSNNLQDTEGTTLMADIFFSCIPWINFIIGMILCSYIDKLMYSTFLVLKAHWVYTFELHTIEHPAYKIMNPERDLVVLA